MIYALFILCFISLILLIEIQKRKLERQCFQIESDFQSDMLLTHSKLSDLNSKILEFRSKFDEILKDKNHKEIKKLLEDIQSQGKGFFEIQRVNEEDYFHRIDPMLIYKK